MPKKILIISRAFYPMNSPRSFRTTELAKELARLGHEVEVLLPENSKSEQQLDYAKGHSIKIKYYGSLQWKQLGQSKLIGDWKRKFGRLLFLLFEYPNIEIYFKLPKYLKHLKKQYDLLISIAVPHENHWAIAKLRSKKNPIAKTWIADCGDPFMDNKLERISPPFYFRFLENRFLKKADYVTVPTQGSIAGYNQKYHHKFKVIPQGFSFENIKIVDRFSPNTPIEFAYAGGVSASGVRSPHQLIKYLLSLKQEFRFHIYSNNSIDLKHLAKQSKGRIILHHPIPRSELLFELSKMDFLVNLDNGVSIVTPSKLIDYTLAKRPILNILPENIDINLINQFLDQDYSNAKVINNINDYNIINVAKSFLELDSGE
jgi:hypothetical protein